MIQILPDYLANQIAAGEVVQRPESVVKEVVENSIDAGATSVTVLVKGAGRQLIHIVDNGGGMSRDDLELCCVRHATSKISNADDLHAIKTLGFRGEAMASIAAVADVEIRSRRASDAVGNVLHVRPGHNAEIRAIATDIGTQVFVRNLFYNVPARRKFLKSELTEFRYISESMQRLALSHPEVRFVFYDGNVIVFDLQPDTLKIRITDLLGLEEGALLPVSNEESGVSVSGFVALPEYTRTSRSGQFLFLNGRSINSRSLSHAVLTAFDGIVGTGRHPVFVLHLGVDVGRVDVNVHPQKQEVKFDDERIVYLLIQKAVSNTLSAAGRAPSALADFPLSARPMQAFPVSGDRKPLLVNRYTGEILDVTANPLYQDHRTPITPTSIRSGYDALFGKAQNESSEGPLGRTSTAVICLKDGIIATSGEQGLVLIDQSSAHERVLFERLMDKSRTGAAAPAQALLFAATVRMDSAKVSMLSQYKAELEYVGFRFSEADGLQVEITAVPADVSPGNEEQALVVLLEDVESSGEIPTDKKRETIVMHYARRYAVNRGAIITVEEAQTLVSDLRNCRMAHRSPSGKPTFIIIPFQEINSRFCLI